MASSTGLVHVQVGLGSASKPMYTWDVLDGSGRVIGLVSADDAVKALLGAMTEFRHVEFSDRITISTPRVD